MTRPSKSSVLPAVGGGMTLLLCCLLGPILLGAIGLVALGPVLELLAVGAAVILGVVAVRRHRASRCCR